MKNYLFIILSITTLSLNAGRYPKPARESQIALILKKMGKATNCGKSCARGQFIRTYSANNCTNDQILNHLMGN